MALCSRSLSPSFTYSCCVSFADLHTFADLRLLSMCLRETYAAEEAVQRLEARQAAGDAFILRLKGHLRALNAVRAACCDFRQSFRSSELPMLAQWGASSPMKPLLKTHFPVL